MPRHRPTRPAALLQTIAPYRAPIALAVACLCTWSGLADLGAREGMPFVLGPALSRTALHRGKANNDQSDAQHMAVLRRGGMRPHAYVSLAKRRATRALLRRRLPLMRQRAERLPPVQHPHGQDHGPEMGQQSASTAKRAGVAERCPDPAVPQRLAVARALSASDERLLQALALTLVTTATPPAANMLSWLQTVPGLGPLLRLGLVDARHAMARFPRLPDGVSACRVVTGAQASAGQRDGPAGPTRGPASLTWACSDAAVVCLRHHPAGPKSLAR